MTASQTWRKLLKHPLVGEMQAELIFRAALAENLAEGANAAKALRDRLEKEFPDAMGTVAGKEVKLLEALDGQLAQAPWEKHEIAGDEWPAFGGNAARNGILSTDASIRARLWSVDFGVKAQANNSSQTTSGVPGCCRARQIQQMDGTLSGYQAPESLALPSFPILSNGQLFVNLGDQVMSMSANAGAMLWTYPKPSASGKNPSAAALDSLRAILAMIRRRCLAIRFMRRSRPRHPM